MHQMLSLLFRYILIFLLVLSFGLTGAFANASSGSDSDVFAEAHTHDAMSKAPSHDQEHTPHDEGYVSCLTLVGHCISFQVSQNSEATLPSPFTLLTLRPGDDTLWASRALEVDTPPPRS